ncbi:hypothetical protein Pelo_18843 [Pelomyxa schiedti]|nr:hypothetical protein Pelo_18843 [Pelomyxa schiedti]
MSKQAVSLLPQCVLRELIQSWVLEPSRCVAIHIESIYAWGRHCPPAAMYVLLSVSPTLGVTGGTPTVLNTYNTALPSVRFLSPTVMLCEENNVVCAVDLTRRRDTVVVGGKGSNLWDTLYNHKWMMLKGPSCKLSVWRVSKGFPEGDPLELDLIFDAEGRFFPGEPFLTRSQPAELIADGDELCIVIDKMYSSSIVRIYDMRRCFDSRAWVITKEFYVDWEREWGVCSVMDVMTDKEKRLIVVHSSDPYPKPVTLMKDVVSGVLTVFQTSLTPVGDTHYAVECHQDDGQTHFSVFETGSNKLVRGWDGPEEVILGSGFLFTKENHMVKCVDALSGVHVASFYVDVRGWKVHGTDSLLPENL